MAARGTAPEHVRCDNGPELTANALHDWCQFAKAGSAYIEPGSPWQNPYVESFGSRVRDELLGVELFASLTEAQVMVADWRDDYNERRPHSSLQMLAPARFARSWRENLETAQPITLAGPAEARRTPQSGSTSRRRTGSTQIAPMRAHEPWPSSRSARPPGSLRATTPLPTMQPQPTTDSHCGWTDEGGPASHAWVATSEK